VWRVAIGRQAMTEKA